MKRTPVVGNTQKSKRKKKHQDRLKEKIQNYHIQYNGSIEVKQSEAKKEYDKIIQKDYEIQQKAVALEYVDVEKCQKLYDNSKAYIKKLQTMSKKQKFDKSEIKHYDSDIDQQIINDKNHFILHSILY